MNHQPRTILDPMPPSDVEVITGNPLDAFELASVSLRVLAHLAAVGELSKAAGVYVARMYDDLYKVSLLADADDWPRGADLADLLERHIDDIDGWDAPRWQVDHPIWQSAPSDVPDR